MRNILPYDGETIYYGQILTPRMEAFYEQVLMNEINWRNDEAIIFGKHFVTKRMVAWYGDEAYAYTYSKRTREALPWTAKLLELRNLVESLTNSKFNSCLLNLYHDGNEGMSWHSDDEKTLAANSYIASLSFGAKRRFLFRHKKTSEQISLNLEPGSLLLMKENTQKNWLHSLPKAAKVKKPRINLTFRTMDQRDRLS